MKLPALRGVVDSALKAPKAWVSKLELKKKSFRFRGRNGWYWLALEQFEMVADAFGILEDFMAKPSGEYAAHFREVQKRSDTCEELFVETLDRAPATKRSEFPRSDWFRLSRCLGDALRCAKSIMEKMILFQVSSDAALKEMARLQNLACADLAAAMKGVKSHPRRSTENIVRAKKAFAQVMYHKNQAQGRLYGKSNMVEKIKVGDIYRDFSDAANEGTVAAELLGDILVKST